MKIDKSKSRKLNEIRTLKSWASLNLRRKDLHALELKGGQELCRWKSPEKQLEDRQMFSKSSGKNVVAQKRKTHKKK